MINQDLLQPLDIAGTTSLEPPFLSVPIKGITWGWEHSLDETKASHIVVAVIDKKDGKKKWAEMLPNGINFSPLSAYDNPPAANIHETKDHLVFLKRHPLLNPTTPNLISQANDYLNLLRDQHEKYGYSTLFDYISKIFDLNIPEMPGHCICSALPFIVMQKLEIPIVDWKYPQPSPMDWQLEPVCKNVVWS